MSLNILIVDDSPVMRGMIARTLRLSGLPLGTLYEAGDGRAGAESAQSNWVDLVLTDLNMPGMDGEAMIVALRAREATAALPVVVVSSDASTSRRERMAAHGVAFVQKPFTPEQLRTVVLTTLQLTDAEFTGRGAAALDSCDF